jgi:hypothetical protein
MQLASFAERLAHCPAALPSSDGLYSRFHKSCKRFFRVILDEQSAVDGRVGGKKILGKMFCHGARRVRARPTEARGRPVDLMLLASFGFGVRLFPNVWHRGKTLSTTTASPVVPEACIDENVLPLPFFSGILAKHSPTGGHWAAVKMAAKECGKRNKRSIRSKR